MTPFAVQLGVICTVLVFLALLMAREYARVYGAEGGKRWPLSLTVLSWLLFGAVALLLLGRYSQLAGGGPF